MQFFLVYFYKLVSVSVSTIIGYDVTILSIEIYSDYCVIHILLVCLLYDMHPKEDYIKIGNYRYLAII